MPWAICSRSSLRMPSRMAHIAVSRPTVLKRKVELPQRKSGRTVSSTFGSGIVFIDGSTSPSSPGRYQRAPSLWRKPQTALKLPRSSSPQISSVSFFSVTAPSGLPVSPGSLSRFLYNPARGMPYGAPTIFSHSACARGMSPLLRANGSAARNRCRRRSAPSSPSRGDAIRAVLQTVRLHRIVRARADEDLHRLAGRRGDDGQPRAADLLDTGVGA
jgi:hypothetical protein